MNNKGIYAVFFTIDLLFIPFIIPVPLSLLIWPLWFFQNLKNINKNIAVPAFTSAFLVIFSYLYNLNINSQNIKILTASQVNTGIYIYMLLMLLMLNNVIINVKESIYNILIAYIIFSLLLSIIFLLDAQIYFTLRANWTVSKDIIEVGTLSTLTRYTGILSDPNNMSVSICAITAALISINPKKPIRNIALLACTLIIVISTMSATGFICLVVLTIFFTFFCEFGKNRETDTIKRFAIITLATLSFIMIIFIVKDNPIFQLSIDRVLISDADSRFSRWHIVFDLQKVMQSIWIGDGGTITWNNQEYKPHNGHLHVIFSFGIISYILFLILLCRVSQYSALMSNTYLLILVFGFTVNVGIYEPRFTGIWILLLTLHHAHFVHRPKQSYKSKELRVRL